jgi:hypothetical protein
MGKAGAELLFDVMSCAYESINRIVKTNPPFENWTEVLDNVRPTGTTLDRLTHRCHIVETGRESYRLKDARRSRMTREVNKPGPAASKGPEQTVVNTVRPEAWTPRRVRDDICLLAPRVSIGSAPRFSIGVHTEPSKTPQPRKKDAMRHKRRTMWAVFAASICLVSPASDARGDDAEREEQAFKVGVEAYAYGYPLVLMDVTRRVMTHVSSPRETALLLNQFAHARSFPGPEIRSVVSPNVDTLYSVAWLDVSREPVVLHVPDTQGRYYLMPMLGAWTNVFASPGKRTTGTGEGDFAIVGPGWQGTLPDGVREIKAPTGMVWIIGRTQTNGNADYEPVHAIQRQYTLTPLSSFGKAYTTPTKVPVDPKVDAKTPPVNQVERMDVATFFGTMTRLMKDNPPPPADAPVVKRLASIGIVAGDEFDPGRLDGATRKGLERALKAAREKIKEPPSDVRSLIEDGWLVQRTGMGSYGANYQKRAYVALIGLGANLPQDAIYPMTRVDGDGKPLTGANRYVIHFDKGRTPPVNAFWSVTVYDMEQFLVPNPIKRYAIGDRDRLKFNEDGSLDLFVQHGSPGPEKESNWLPTLEGPFNLIMRLYWPKESMLDGSWKVPPVQRLP